MSRSVLRQSLVLVLATTALLLSASAAQGAGGWTKVVSGGFGNPNNTYFPDSAVFRGCLYVSTISSPGATMFSGSSKAGGEVWRSRDGASWKRVVKPGFGDRENIAIRLAVFGDRLYALADNSQKGFSAWVSSDGLTFRRLGAPGFGNSERGLAQPFVFSGRLLLGVARSPGGAEIWASDDGEHFREVVKGGLGDKGNTGIEMMRFNDGAESRVEPVLDGTLYVGTSNPTSGGEVWRTNDGLTWERVADNGLGRRTNIGLAPEVTFDGQVYVAGTGFKGLDSLGVDVFRSADGTSWEKVVSNGFNAGLHRNTFAFLAVFKNALYLVTSSQDPRVLTPPHPSERFALHGFELRRSTDGVSWKRIGTEGFGNSTSFLATLELNASLELNKDQLYLAATDYRRGGSVWRTNDGTRWTRIFHEPKASMFNEGLDAFAYQGRLLVFSNDLASGAAIWRSGFEVGGGHGSETTTTATTETESTETSTTTETESTETTTTTTSTSSGDGESSNDGGGGGGSTLAWLIAAGLGGALAAGAAVFFGLRRSRGGSAAAGSAQSSATSESSAAAAQSSRFCAGCGKEFIADARFCPNCGRPREAG